MNIWYRLNRTHTGTNKVKLHVVFYTHPNANIHRKHGGEYILYSAHTDLNTHVFTYTHPRTSQVYKIWNTCKNELEGRIKETWTWGEKTNAADLGVFEDAADVQLMSLPSIPPPLTPPTFPTAEAPIPLTLLTPAPVSVRSFPVVAGRRGWVEG